jgi:hypothetical protein
VSAWKDTKQEKKNPLATTETIKRIGKSLFKQRHGKLGVSKRIEKLRKSEKKNKKNRTMKKNRLKF